jgi:enoyl-CoA hydratase/carnithine racemase
MDERTITTEARGRLFLIGLNRPAKRNAFTRRMLRELAEAFTTFERDADRWVAVLFAHGDHFTAGLDLADVGPAVAAGAPLSPDGAIDPLDLWGVRRRKPVVCGVQGVCFTIGIELLLACDLRVAAAGTRFAQMEVRRGIMPFGGATLRFAAQAGWARGMKWMLTGDEFDAREALTMGLVSDVVPDGAVLESAITLAERVASRAPLAVQATLASARLAIDEGRDVALESLMTEARALFSTDDAREGLASFLERREARFSGR